MNENADDKTPSMMKGWIGRESEIVLKSLNSHTKIISHMKFALTGVAFILFMLIITWPFINKFDSKLKITFTTAKNGEAAKPKMISPNFHGIDRNNQPFNISASDAVQKDSNTIVLHNVNGDMSFKDKSWLNISAKNGTIDPVRKQVKLQDNVNMILDSGFEMNTSSAYVDLGKSSAYGDEPVVVQGPPGTLRAKEFEVKKKGDIILFKKDIEMIIYPATGKK